MKTINQTLLSLFFIGAAFTTQAETSLPGLEAPVKVVRDSSGIPHICAENQHDVFFMRGWAHAQDRLFQMDTARRQIAGTLAELLGTGALETDVLFLPGGESAIPGSPFYINLLEPWLLNETHPLRVSPGQNRADAFATENFVPPTP